MVIPWLYRSLPLFGERLNHPISWDWTFKNHVIHVFVEPTKSDYLHACTPDDVQYFLTRIPQEHLEEIDILVFRQPTKKEEILQPVWGKYVFYVELGWHSGPGIYLQIPFAPKACLKTLESQRLPAEWFIMP